MVVLLLVVLVLAMWLAASTLFAASVSQPVAAGVLLSAVSVVVFVALLVRVTIAQPGLGIGLPDELVAVQLPGLPRARGDGRDRARRLELDGRRAHRRARERAHAAARAAGAARAQLSRRAAGRSPIIDRG